MQGARSRQRDQNVQSPLCTEELDVFWRVREIGWGRAECRAAMGRLARGGILDGGRDRIPQWVLGHARELPPSSTKGSVGEYGLRGGLCWTVLRDYVTCFMKSWS